MKLKTVILLCFLAITACQSRNKLNTDEQKLVAQITTEEQKKLANKENKKYTTTPDTFPIGIRFQPERAIDPNNPPEIIDIAGNINNIQEFKLSDIAKNIRYIRLESPGDSAFLGRLSNQMGSSRNTVSLKEELPFHITKNKDFIVAHNFLGMLLYNSDGKLLRIISKNEFSGFKLSKHGVGGGSHSVFQGSTGIPRLTEDKVYYNFWNDENEISKIMEVDCNSVSILMPGSSENHKKLSVAGNPIAVTSGKNSYSTVPLNISTVAKVGHPRFHEDMFTIYDKRGDTLCSFPGNQKMENYTKSVGRTPDWGNNFFYKNNFYFREAHSDTIFKVVPPNKLMPAFIIKLGEYKIQRMQDGMDPGYDLSNKFLPKSLFVTDDLVFIYYTKNYNSPHARKTKTVEFYHAIFNRKTRELEHVKHDPHTYEFALENDLDGGLPHWPTWENATREMVKSIQGYELKEHIKTDAFKNSNAPANKKKELVKLANAVGKYETIVVVMK